MRVIITTFHLVVKSDSHTFGKLYLFLDLIVVLSLCTALVWAVHNLHSPLFNYYTNN